MKAFLVMALTLSFGGFLAEQILPSENMKSVMRFLCMLCSLYAVLFSFVPAVKNTVEGLSAMSFHTPEIPAASEENPLIKKTLAQYEKDISREISSQTGISGIPIRIEYTASGNNVVLERVISCVSADIPESVAAHLADIFGEDGVRKEEP